MAHAEKCPLCNGSGKKSTVIPSGTDTQGFVTSPCHGCGGQGWVLVEGTPLLTSPYWTYLRYAGFNSKTAVHNG